VPGRLRIREGGEDGLVIQERPSGEL